MIEQPLAGAIHQPQAAVGVEGEDGDVNLLDDFAQQRRGFERPQPLFAERRLQGVRLAKDFAERVVGSSAAGADREIAFAEGREEIRERAQGEDDAVGGGE